MKDLSEKQLTSEQLVDGKLLKVFRDRVQTQEGESIREWIDHPGASAVVPYFADGSTILVRQFRYPPRQTFLEVPAGKLDKKGEHPEDVAERELEEETGYRAGKLVHLGSFYPGIGYSNEIIHFFLAEDLTEGTQQFSDGEFLEIEKLPFSEAVSMAYRGEILDMKSIIALLFAEAHLNGRAK